jgi:hypothetical protein
MGVDGRSLASAVPSAVNSTARSSMLRSGRLILLVALITAAGGLIGGLLSQRRAVYEAEAVVAASTTPLPADNFTDLGVALFRTDTVLQPVIGELNLDITPQALLSEGYLEVESVTNAVAVRIIAQDSDPQLAAELVNAAADSFASALSDNEMGTFAVFADDAVSRSSGQSPLQSTLLAAALGLVLGTAILLVRTFVMQPLLTKEEALSVYPADVAYLAKVHTGGTFRFRQGDSYNSLEVFPQGLAQAIRRSTEAKKGIDSLSSCYVLVERNRRGDKPVRALMEELRVSGVTEQSEDANRRDLKWIEVSDRHLGKAIEDAGVIAALVSEGVSRRSLQLLTEELLVAPGRRLLIMVFVRAAHRRPTVNGVRTSLRQLVARWWSSMRRQFSGSRSGGA